MNHLNSVLIEGNMVRDPLIRTTAAGTKVCAIEIASNFCPCEDEWEVNYFEVEAWGELAEACSAKGKKGVKIRAVGRLKQDRWTGSDGKAHFKVSIVAEHIEYCPTVK